jgi:hypothetical protein
MQVMKGETMMGIDVDAHGGSLAMRMPQEESLTQLK